MSSVSIVIPVAEYHRDLVDRAVASCYAQTVPVDIIVVNDTDHKGAGAARNQGLADVQTPYVVFLDADDTIAPDFIERTLAAIQPRHYVYTDWFRDTEIIRAPACPFTNRTFHVITTLLWTGDVRAIGGFDETLPAAEDTDLYLHLMQDGVCGLHIPEPLFVYGPEGRRASDFIYGAEPRFIGGIQQTTPGYERVMTLFGNRYGSNPMAGCGGCGGSNNTVIETLEGEPGDVKALALWGGNRRQTGPVSGRLYPRSGNMTVMHVDPADAAARPDLWRAVEPAPTVHRAPQQQQWQRIEPGRAAPFPPRQPEPSPVPAAEQMGRVLYPDLRDEPEAPPTVSADRPDVEKLRAMRRKTG